jgi:hypothetical protein
MIEDAERERERERERRREGEGEGWGGKEMEGTRSTTFSSTKKN